MKKITLTAITIFAIVLGVLFIGSNFTPQNNHQNISNVESLTQTDINPPNINISKLIFSSKKINPDSFTLAEIAKHGSRNDCYLIINNNVYNVSSYISYHPGGSRTITSRCGKEVTGIFARIHSNRAWDLLKKYKIGTITTSKIDITPQILTAISNALKEANPNAEIIKVSPKTNFYVAKIIYNGKLYEIHIDNNGQIIKEEVENDEFNWSLWENDNDDK